MRRLTALFIATSFVFVSAPGCAVDDDTTETNAGDTGGGDGVSLDANPGEDSSVDSGSPDTTVEEDTTVPDTGVAETTAPDTSAPEVFVDTGFPFDTFIDTMVPDGFVAPSCTTTADCPFTDLECAKKTCIGGKCGVNFIAKGTPTGPQTAGDCKRRECDGAGLAVIGYDPTDPPKDIDQCLNEYCDGAEAKLDPQPVGYPCSTSLGTKCDGKGKCVQCVTASDCPGSDDPCNARTCDLGVCGNVKVADGKPAVTQVAGDCYTLMCNVGGTIDSSSPTYRNYAPTDVPSCTGQPCRTGACEDGYPYCADLPSGTTCDGTFTCGGYPGPGRYGVCGECDVPSDCGYSQGFAQQIGAYGDTCEQNTCAAHKCGVSYGAVGTTCTTGYYACPGTCQPVSETGTATYCQTTGPCGSPE